MKDPANAVAYEQRFHQGEIVEGEGADVHVISPCPACAAPGWLRFPLLSMREVMERGAECKECGRSFRTVFTVREGGMSFELVQTGGSDPPEYLPKMRRACA